MKKAARSVGLMLSLVFMLLFALAPGVQATGDVPDVPPEYVEGNPSCKDLGYAFGFKPQPEPPPSGTYAFPDSVNSLTITSDGTYFSWTSTLGVDAVIVKGGNNANAYIYVPPAESFGDGGLSSPINPNNGKPYDISHIEFCYDYELAATKTAEAKYTRTYTWSIAKSVTPDSFSGTAGDTFTANYTVDVDRTAADTGFAVAGTIVVNNPSPLAVNFSVADAVNGTVAAVACPTYSLAPWASTTCTYSLSLGDTKPADGTNIATVTSSTTGVSGATASADYAFGAPTTIVGPATVQVNDSLQGALGTADPDKPFQYPYIFGCPTDQAAYKDGVYVAQAPNTATIVETGQSATALVTLRCTLPALTATKTAQGIYDRTVTWTLDKTVSNPALSGFAGGDTPGVKWYVAATKHEAIGNYQVVGAITIVNPAAVAQTFGVADVLDDGIVAAVTCPAYVIPAFGSVTCSYTALPQSAAATLNTATIAAVGNADSTATAQVGWKENLIGSDNAVLTDPRFKFEQTINGTVQVPFKEAFACPSDPALYAGDGIYPFSVSNEALLDDGDSVQQAVATINISCYAPIVSKTAQTALTRTWSWTIDKTADKVSLSLAVGQAHAVSYKVVMDATSRDSQWGVAGAITVQNPSSDAAMSVSLADMIEGGIVATLDCANPLAVPAGGSATCGYSANLPDGALRVNTATATLNGADFSGTAPVDFAQAKVTAVDECATVTDDKAGNLGDACAPKRPVTFTYVGTVGPYGVCGAYQYANTATFTTGDSKTSGSDTWTIAVDVPCVGCTLTQGYWKTHSDRGPAPYDAGWKKVGPLEEDTLFFLSGKIWYEVLWTPVRSNVYYNLAHQYIAAKLNILNGAGTTPEVTAAITAAEKFFATKTPSSTLTKSERNAALKVAAMLDRYNNGEIGPGHCSEDEFSTSGLPGLVWGSGLFLPAVTR